MTPARKAGQAGDFDAVTFAGAARLHVTQKDDFVRRFFHGNMTFFTAGSRSASSVSS